MIASSVREFPKLSSIDRIVSYSKGDSISISARYVIYESGDEALRRLFKIAATAAGAISLVLVPTVAAHAQDSIGGGSLPTSGSSYFQPGSSETIWDANRFNRTFTEQEITKCWEDAEGGVSTGFRPCPLRPITEMDLAVARLLFGSGYLLFGSMG